MVKWLHHTRSAFNPYLRVVCERPYFVIKADLLNRWWDEKRGLFKLAVMLSLPYGFFLWGYDNSFTSDSLLTSKS